MLTEIYIEALLVDKKLADEVWEAWDKGEIDDQVAWLAWWTITLNAKQSDNFLLRLKDNIDKAKPAERRGRKATGPRLLREATECPSKDPKTA